MPSQKNRPRSAPAYSSAGENMRNIGLPEESPAKIAAVAEIEAMSLESRNQIIIDLTILVDHASEAMLSATTPEDHAAAQKDFLLSASKILNEAGGANLPFVEDPALADLAAGKSLALARMHAVREGETWNDFHFEKTAERVSESMLHALGDVRKALEKAMVATENTRYFEPHLTKREITQNPRHGAYSVGIPNQANLIGQALYNLQAAIAPLVWTRISESANDWQEDEQTAA